MTPRRVVHIIEGPGFGGAERVATRIAAAHDRSRWDPLVLHGRRSGFAPLVAQLDAAGVPSLPVPPLTGLGALGVPAAALRLRRLRPAVVHAHLTWPLGCAGWILAAAAAQVPLVLATVHLHPPLPTSPSTAMLRRIVPRCVGLWTAVSRATAERLQVTLRLDPDRLHVVPNGIPLPPLDDAPRGDSGATVLAVARLAPEKGLDVLIDAAAAVPAATFLIAGTGPESEALVQRTRAAGLSGRVRFLGFVDDVERLMRACDVFVLPSRLEGMPLALLEAMAAGRPVVATAIPGVDEVVEHERTGLLVPPEDPGALASAIATLLADPAAAARLGDAARGAVEDRYTVDRQVGRFEALYEAGLGGAAP